jgi:hypothetical protein
MTNSDTPVGLQVVHNRDVVLELSARRLVGHRTEARVTMRQPPGSHDVTIVSDEGGHRGAGDSAPNPLAYFSAALAF